MVAHLSCLLLLGSIESAPQRCIFALEPLYPLHRPLLLLLHQLLLSHIFIVVYRPPQAREAGNDLTIQGRLVCDQVFLGRSISRDLRVQVVDLPEA